MTRIASNVNAVKAIPRIQCLTKKVTSIPMINSKDATRSIENSERNVAKVLTSPSILSIISPGLCSL